MATFILPIGLLMTHLYKGVQMIMKVESDLERIMVSWTGEEEVSKDVRKRRWFVCEHEQVVTSSHVPLGWGVSALQCGDPSDPVTLWLTREWHQWQATPVTPRANVAQSEWIRLEGRQIAFEPEKTVSPLRLLRLSGSHSPHFSFFSLRKCFVPLHLELVDLWKMWVKLKSFQGDMEEYVS